MYKFYLKNYPFTWDEELLAQAQKDWDDWCQANQETLLMDLEEDCAPTKRYHYKIVPTSVADYFYICFNDKEYLVGDNE